MYVYTLERGTHTLLAELDHTCIHTITEKAKHAVELIVMGNKCIYL